MIVVAGDSLSSKVLVCAKPPPGEEHGGERGAADINRRGEGGAADIDHRSERDTTGIARGGGPLCSGRGQHERHEHYEYYEHHQQHEPRERHCSGRDDGGDPGVGSNPDGGRAARLAAVVEQVRAVQARHRPETERHATGLSALDTLLGGGFSEAAIHELVAGKEAAAVDAVAWRAASAAAGGSYAEAVTGVQRAAAMCVSRADILDIVNRRAEATTPAHLLTSPPAHLFTPSPARALTLSSRHDGAPAAATGARRWLVYIDSDSSLFPPALAAMGVPLERLLVVRVSRMTDVLWTFEQCLRCRAVAAVIATLRELDVYVSRRLQLAAEQGASLGFVLRPDTHVGHTFAATRLRFDPMPLESDVAGGPAFSRSFCTGEPASGRSFVANHSRIEERPVGGRSPSTFPERGLDQTRVRRLRVTPLKLRDGGLREPVVVELCDAADTVSMDAIPVDRTSAPRRRATG